MMQPTAIHFDAYQNQLEVAFVDGSCQRLDAHMFHPDGAACRIEAIAPDEQLVIHFADGQIVTVAWQAVYDLVLEQCHA